MKMTHVPDIDQRLEGQDSALDVFDGLRDLLLPANYLDVRSASIYESKMMISHVWGGDDMAQAVVQGMAVKSRLIGNEDDGALEDILPSSPFVSEFHGDLHVIYSMMDRVATALEDYLKTGEPTSQIDPYINNIRDDYLITSLFVDAIGEYMQEGSPMTVEVAETTTVARFIESAYRDRNDALDALAPFYGPVPFFAFPNEAIVPFPLLEG